MSAGWTFADVTLRHSLRTGHYKATKKVHSALHSLAHSTTPVRMVRPRGLEFFRADQNVVRKRLLFAVGWVTFGGEAI